MFVMCIVSVFDTLCHSSNYSFVQTQPCENALIMLRQGIIIDNSNIVRYAMSRNQRQR